jgi:hypothetical protein
MPDLPDYARSRAILIGTGVYQDPGFLPLPAALNSLAGMRQVLTHPGLCGWPEDRVSVLQDPTDMPRLVQTLRRLARATEDVLLVYFVGHGVILPRGQLCLVLTDTNLEHADVTGLDYQRVREALADSPARVKVAVLDCCYSGRAIEALSAATEIADSTDTRGVYTLTASDHSAHVVPLDQQANTTTSFTGEMLELVRAGIPGGSEQLTLGELYRHLRHRLRRRDLPEPNQRGTDTADRFPFARNAAYQPGPPPTPLPEPVSVADELAEGDWSSTVERDLLFGETEQRIAAVRELGSGRDVDAVPLLVRGFDATEDPDVSCRIIWALGELGTAAARDALRTLRPRYKFEQLAIQDALAAWREQPQHQGDELP